jgi:predicted RNA-binding Zn ribbon-like protein
VSRRPPRALLAVALVTALCAATTARAQSAPTASASPAAAPTPDQIARAKTLFDLGAKAYDSEQFPAAIQAFLEAYRLSQRPGPIFSAAQAYRRIHATDRSNAEALRQAVRYYKEYIEKQKAGGRVGEAQQALRDLEPLLVQLASVPAGSAPVATPTTTLDVKPKTRLMVSSPTKGAMASLDGGEPAEMPLIQELTPGTHTLRLAAEGYVDDEREIIAVEGEVYGLDINLRERSAFLTLRTTEGAQVLVDGRPEGVAPLLKPIEIAPGTHVVTLTKTGHQPYSAELELRRDQKRPLDAPLDLTSQRYASFVTFGAAGVGLLGGAVLTLIAFREEEVALEIERIKDAGNITEKQRVSHDDAIANRDTLRGAAISSFGAAGLLALVGAGLFFFDRPTPGVPITLRDDSSPKAPEAKRKRKLDASVVPLLGPTGGGALVEMRF